MIAPDDNPLRLCVFGAGPGTGNLGVSALAMSLLAAIARRCDDPQVTIFDNGRGLRDESVHVADRDLPFRLCGAAPSRRFYRPDTLWHIRAAGRLGGLGNAAIDAIRQADAVLDATSGDSFTDLYSRRRFRLVIAEKQLALEQGTPLILLPQTIGPFRSAHTRRIARDVLRRAHMVWTRDRRSDETLRALLGSDWDPDRHRCGVDMAFGLDAQAPRALDARLRHWLDEPWVPLVGLNVSGLILNDRRAHFGARADYRTVMTRLLERLLRESDARVLLVPHVFTHEGHAEHDPDACAAIAQAVDHDDRVLVMSEGLDPGETKWIVARTDWMCATRMHAAIAALSSGVPTAALAYSDKTLGVFETCGQGEHVADLRRLPTGAVLERLWRSFLQRAESESALARRLHVVMTQADSQMDLILGRCKAMRQESPTLRLAA